MAKIPEFNPDVWKVICLITFFTLSGSNLIKFLGAYLGTQYSQVNEVGCLNKSLKVLKDSVQGSNNIFGTFGNSA